MLQIAKDLELDPSKAAGQRIAFIGASGSGKSYGCGRYVEQMHAANVPQIIIDTVGIWPALRLAKDGKKAGLPFVIIGGEHADVEIDLAGGVKLARFLIETNASVVIDVSDFTPEDRAPFIADLCGEILIRVKTKRRPRVVIFDEAQDVVPEKPRKGDKRMRDNVTALIRKGRNHLCGCVLLSQRPQDISKAALNQCGNMFVGGLFAKHERDAVRDWVGAKARSVEVEAQLRDLPSLQPGEFYFWSPQWLRIYQRIKILPKWTFDGSSTTPLDSDADLGALAPVDLASLRAVVAPEPKAPSPGLGIEDPAFFDATWADERDKLEAERNAAWSRADEAEANEVKINATLDRAREWVSEAITTVENARAQLGRLEVALSRPRYEDGAAVFSAPTPLHVSNQAEIDAAHGRVCAPNLFRDTIPMPSSLEMLPEFQRSRGYPKQGPGPVIGPGARRAAKTEPTAARTAAPSYTMALLAVIATHGPLNRAKLSILSGKSKTSSTFRDALAQLEGDGYIQRSGGTFSATSKGQAKAPKLELPKGRALFDYWCGKLGDYERAVFRAIATTRHGYTRGQLAQAAGVSGTSSTFRDALTTLRRIDLIVIEDRIIKLTRLARESMGL